MVREQLDDNVKLRLRKRLGVLLKAPFEARDARSLCAIQKISTRKAEEGTIVNIGPSSHPSHHHRECAKCTAITRRLTFKVRPLTKDRRFGKYENKSAATSECLRSRSATSFHRMAR